MVHGLGNTPFVPEFAIPPPFRDAITKLLDEQLGPGRAQLRSMSSIRAEATDEYHNLQLREKPSDPSTHSNYGAYLKDKKGDSAGAARAYERAIELDPSHVNALGNLANVKWEHGDTASAETLYRRALGRKPCNENVAFNFARFLAAAKADWIGAAAVARDGINDNPNSARLHLLLGELTLLNGDGSDALATLRRARENGADQARVECALACALHVVGAGLGECLAAYRVAVALNPQNATLKLNLSQLLFLRGDDTEANRQLQQALQVGLDDGALLEAAFYQLAHTSVEPEAVLQDVKERLARGARLRWNVLPNIEKLRAENPGRAELLAIARKVITGEENPAALAHVVARWRLGNGRSRMP